ncbi:MAG: DinB family protein [Micrococcales bacterium]|nr:DinB family protein [Micrococcales bacterium]
MSSAPGGMPAAKAAALGPMILLDAFGRVHEELPQILAGLSIDDLTWRPDPDANSIGWLVWHLTRVQDDHLAALATACERPRDQAWRAWRGRFDLPYGDGIGYGHTSTEVGAFTIGDPGLLLGYHGAVHILTTEVIEELSARDYARIVDTRWDPPVNAAARLVSVVNDTTAHCGQAAYLAGMLQRRTA